MASSVSLYCFFPMSASPATPFFGTVESDLILDANTEAISESKHAKWKRNNTQIDDAVRFPYSAEPQEGETQTLESTKYERVTDHGYKQ